MITEWRIILRPGGPSRETMAQPRTLVRLPADGLLNLGQSGSLTRLANARIWAPCSSARGAAALFARAGWLMAVAASGDAVTIVSSNDPALLPVAVKSAGGS